MVGTVRWIAIDGGDGAALGPGVDVDPNGGAPFLYVKLNSATISSGLKATINGLEVDRSELFTSVPGAGNVALDFSVRNHLVGLNGDINLIQPINLKARQSGRIVFWQETVGGRQILSTPGGWKIEGGLPALSAGLSAFDMLRYEVDDALRIWCSFHKGMA